jgi:hypothetical protein
MVGQIKMDLEELHMIVDYGLDLPGSRQRPVAGCCEHGNQSFGSIIPELLG